MVKLDEVLESGDDERWREKFGVEWDSSGRSSED